MISLWFAGLGAVVAIMMAVVAATDEYMAREQLLPSLRLGLLTFFGIMFAIAWFVVPFALIEAAYRVGL